MNVNVVLVVVVFFFIITGVVFTVPIKVLIITVIELLKAF